MHFYFVGFLDQRDWNYSVKVASDLFGDGKDWHFSPKDFSNVQEKFEKMISGRWGYSGGTDLLVVPYRIRKEVFYIDANKVLDIKLFNISKDSKDYMPEEIVQIIVRQLKSGKDIYGVSNSRIMDGIKEGLKNSFLSMLPGDLAKCFSTLEPFASGYLQH